MQLPKISFENKKLRICFHDWRNLKVSAGLLRRNVMKRRFCPNCKTHQVRKLFDGWIETGNEQTIEECMAEVKKIEESVRKVNKK